jgi:hypothetical protein
MDLVLSLQKLAATGADLLDLTSSNSNTCSSDSTGGCVIRTQVQVF